MSKGFYTNIIKNNDTLFSAIIAFNLQHFQNNNADISSQDIDKTLSTYLDESILHTYMQKKQHSNNTTNFFYWNFADETKRLLLMDTQSLYQLALLFGISLHAQEISLKIKKEDVLCLKEFLGTENYFYALSRAKFRFHTLCQLYQNKDEQLPLTTKIFQHGQDALYHCTDTWEEPLKHFFANNCQENLPYLANQLKNKQNETISNHHKRLIWFGIKKILLKELNSKWLPYFN